MALKLFGLALGATLLASSNASSVYLSEDLATADLAASSSQNLHAEQVMQQVQARYINNTLRGLPAHGSCTKADITVRKEWSALNSLERSEYIAAVKCLVSLPARTSSSYAPGARTRWDDFVVAHIINTKSIHFSGFLLPWHRQFTWEFEQALRNECNYTGYQPYTEWPRWAYLNTSANPLYDGSSTSLSGDGRYVARNGTTIQLAGGNPPQFVTFPPGQGGGCIHDGPLVNWTINLGPVSDVSGEAGADNPRSDGLGYNPRCLQRDFGPSLLQQFASWSVVANGTVNNTNIHTFHPFVESIIHGSGHGFIGGENYDMYSSPNDPLFFFHHAWIDRAWAMWQALDFASRTNALDGTHTFLNYPPSANVTLRDTIFLSPTFQNISVSQVMSPTKNKYCYIYE